MLSSMGRKPIEWCGLPKLCNLLVLALLCSVICYFFEGKKHKLNFYENNLSLANKKGYFEKKEYRLESYAVYLSVYIILKVFQIF